MPQTQNKQPAQAEIVPRRDLDFGLDDEDIPRYWFGGDAFKTRFFDAMSLLFPEGEKFFIRCVRDYRDGVTDPEMQTQVKDFIFQEGQHGMVHTRFNQRLERQGIDVPAITDEQVRILGWFREHTPAKLTLAQTAAAEHMTAIMAHFFLENRHVLDEADPRIRAMYFWHAVEEIEHKAVAFDVMQKVAKAGYFTRAFAMLYVSVMFPFHVFMIMRHMFRVDGIESKWKLWLKGLWWLYGPRGIYMRMLPHYLAYYLPDFHPWRRGETAAFEHWRRAFDQYGGDPVAATDRFIGQPA